MFYFSNISDYRQYYIAAQKAIWEVLKYDPNVAYIAPAGSIVMYKNLSENSDHDFAAVGFGETNRLVLHPDMRKKRTTDIFYYNIENKIKSLPYLTDDPFQYPYEMYHWLLVDFFSNHVAYITQIGSVIHDNRYLFLFRDGVEKCISYAQKIHQMINNVDGPWSKDAVWRADFRFNKYSTKFAKMNMYILKLMNHILTTGEVKILQEKSNYYPLEIYQKSFDEELNKILKLSSNVIPEIKIDALQSLNSLLSEIKN